MGAVTMFGAQRGLEPLRPWNLCALGYGCLIADDDNDDTDDTGLFLLSSSLSSLAKKGLGEPCSALPLANKVT